MHFHFSSTAFRDIAPENLPQALSSYPSAGLEFTAGLPSREDWKPVMDRLLADGRSVLIHNYFPEPREPFVLNLASADPATSRASLDHCRRALELCSHAGSPFFSLHAGFALEITPSQLGNHLAQSRESVASDPGEALARFLDRTREVATQAREQGLRILIENNVVSHWHVEAGLDRHLLLSTPDAIREAFSQLDGLPVGLLLDVAHARVTAGSLGFDPADFFDLAPLVEALHLSDNDGLLDNNSPFDESAWFVPHLQKLPALPAVVEVHLASPSDRDRQWEALQRISNI